MRIRLTWDDVNFGESEHRVYRSLSPMDPENLPSPYQVLDPNVMEWFDDSVTDQTTYFYRVSAILDSVEYVSAELEVFADQSELYSRDQVTIALVVNDTSHGTTANTRNALISAGFASANIFTALDNAAPPAADIIVLLRSCETQVIYDTHIKPRFEAGTPVIFGSAPGLNTGNDWDMPSTFAKLTGKWEVAASGSSTGIINEYIETNAHYITQPFTALQELQIYPSQTWGYSVTAGQPTVGAVLATGQLNRATMAGKPTLMAIPAGTQNLDGIATPVRSVVWGQVYGLTGYTTNGGELLARCIDWAMGNGAD